MENKSKKITEEISNLFQGKEIEDPENDRSDNTRAKIVAYDDFDNNLEYDVEQHLSEFRKKNVRLLKDVDKKYRGSVVSRKQLDNESIDQNESMDESSDYDCEETDTIESKELYIDSKDSKTNEESEDEYQSSDNSDEENQIAEEYSDDNQNFGTDFEIEDSENKQESDSDEDSVKNEDDYNIIKKGNTENIDINSKVESKLVQKLKASSSDSVKKGYAVQNQLKLWENFLEIRIHTQKILTSGNSLPSSELLNQLRKNNDFEKEINKVTDNLESLLSNFSTLQSKLIASYDETKSLKLKLIQGKRKSGQQKETSNKRSCLENSKVLEENFLLYKPYINAVIQKWDDRTKLFSNVNSKSNKFSTPNDYGILRRIESVLANKKDLIKKTQLHKGSYNLFRPELDKSVYYVSKKPSNINKNDTELVNIDELNGKQNDNDEEKEVFSTEIYDDTEFYHQQLRELIEYKTSSLKNPAEILKQYSELEKVRKKMKKTVDTRASKGRKIRYVVHKKLVNFMAPNPHSKWTNESKDELFNSLFGKIERSSIISTI